MVRTALGDHWPVGSSVLKGRPLIVFLSDLYITLSVACWQISTVIGQMEIQGSRNGNIASRPCILPRFEPEVWCHLK